MLAKILYWLVRLLYRFRAYNLEPLKTKGPVLLLPNHVSWWDWIFIGVCLEDDWRFATSSTTAAISWVHRKIMVNRRTFPVDMNSPYAVKHMAEYLQKGGRLVLFPEGRISTSGSLMKLFDGTGFLIAKTGAAVITAYIRGGQRLRFSRNPDRKKWFPRISVHFSNLIAPPHLDHANVSETRTHLTDWVREQMLKQKFETEMSFGPDTIPAAVTAAARETPGTTIVQDVTMKQLSYRKLLTGANLLAEKWREMLGPEPRAGVLLPNVNAMPAVLLSLWAADRIPAVLNYTTGPAILLSCAKLAGLKHIITSKAFLQRAGLEVAALEAAGIKLVFLEEVRSTITGAQKILGWLRMLARPSLVCSRRHRAEDSAIILFTSGSEGDPKGVELTHRNLLANIRQMLAVIDLMDQDRFFNALPLFHSFGLTVGLLLPLVQGVFVFLYLSPLHYRIVPSAFYNLDCTVLFATNTFLSGYARKAHPYDFHNLRYLFAGAEKLQESTIEVWMRKFGVRVLEGYGATECSPCVAVNVPMRARPGAAGQFLPGIEHKLEPVEGISDAAEPSSGRLLVRGPNVMRGYLNPEANAKFKSLGGWYDTGDIARIDSEHFLWLLGRLKRFAKISGEMVSLTAVEEVLASAFPQYGLKFGIAVIARPDEAKGEKLVAVSNEPKLTLEEIRQAIRSRGLTNLAVPRELKAIHELPRLGTGKINHRELEKMI
jgi:acyl-[acyl-carrier-protein]-phospholipid O-acyltransferase/long-chain-fatty-acid--[acyl-carrier-protein] ligase